MKMEFNRNVLDIDAPKVTDMLVDFIREQVRGTFKRKGIVIGLSGGIDSAVAAYLSVKALGPERVYGILLPEHDSNPVSREYGSKCAEALGIAYSEVEITPMLDAFGVYDKRNSVVKKYFPEYKGDQKFRLVLPQDLLDRDRISAYHLEIEIEEGKIESKRLAHDDYLKMMAANDIKQRVRRSEEHTSELQSQQ